MIEGSEGYWGKFPDVFDTSFQESLRRAMQSKKGKSAGDPWCIGYFSDNEMSWGDETSLSIAALKSPSNQAAKLAFVADLKTKYGRSKTEFCLGRSACELGCADISPRSAGRR